MVLTICTGCHPFYRCGIVHIVAVGQQISGNLIFRNRNDVHLLRLKKIYIIVDVCRVTAGRDGIIVRIGAGEACFGIVAETLHRAFPHIIQIEIGICIRFDIAIQLFQEAFRNITLYDSVVHHNHIGSIAAAQNIGQAGRVCLGNQCNHNIGVACIKILYNLLQSILAGTAQLCPKGYFHLSFLLLTAAAGCESQQ